MKRGDLVPVALQGDLGKPRPALVIQSNYFDAHPSIVLLPLSSTLQGAPLCRVPVQPSTQNGLSKLCEVMVDKVQSVSRAKVGEPFGHLEASTLLEVDRRLAVFLGIAD